MRGGFRFPRGLVGYVIHCAYEHFAPAGVRRERAVPGRGEQGRGRCVAILLAWHDELWLCRRGSVRRAIDPDPVDFIRAHVA